MDYFSFCPFSTAFSQNTTVRAPYSYQLDNGRIHTIDTALSIRDFERLNVSRQAHFGLRSFPNMGLPYQELVFTGDTTIDNRYGAPNSEYHFSPREKIPYYDVKVPYTEAFYMMGYGTGQVFNIIHTPKHQQPVECCG